MNKDEIEQLADDYAASYIQTHTNIPMDSEKYRALVRAFVNFYKATQDKSKFDRKPNCTCESMPCTCPF